MRVLIATVTAGGGHLQAAAALDEAWEAARVAGYVCAIVLLEHGANPWVYAFWRFTETVLGIAVAIAVSLVPKLLRAPEA